MLACQATLAQSNAIHSVLTCNIPVIMVTFSLSKVHVSTDRNASISANNIIIMLKLPSSKVPLVNCDKYTKM